MQFSSLKFRLLTNFVLKVSPKTHFILKFLNFGQLRTIDGKLFNLDGNLHVRSTFHQNQLYTQQKRVKPNGAIFVTDENLVNSKTNILLFLSSLSLCNPKIFLANLTFTISSICWQEEGHRRHPWNILGEEKNGIAKERAQHLSTPKLRYLFYTQNQQLHKICLFLEKDTLYMVSCVCKF